MKHTPTEKLSRIEESIISMGADIQPSSQFVFQTKTKVFQHIDELSTKEISFFLSPRFWQIFKQSFTFVFSFVFAFSLFNIVFLTTTQPSKADYVGVVTSREGDVYILRAKGDEKIQVLSTEKLYEGDTIEVAHDSHAQVYFYNSGETSLSENTKVKIEKVDRGNNTERKIALALQKGQIEAKVDPALANALPPKISIITTSGVVEAGTNADFSVSLNENGTIAQITSSQEKVDLIPTNTPSVIVHEGETLKDGQVAATNENQESSSGSTLASVHVPVPTEEVKKVEKRPENVEKLASLPSVEIMKEKEVKKDTVLPLPETVSIDVYQLGVLQEISSTTDIAQIKIQNAMKELNNKNTTEALAQIRSYNTSLDRIAARIATLKHINTVVPKQPVLGHVVDFTVRNYLTSINSAFTSVLSQINDENKDPYYAVQQKLHHLARIEALLKSRIELQSK